MNYLSLPPLDVGLHSDSPSFSAAAPPLICGSVPLAAVYPVPAHCLPMGQTVPRQQSNPLLLRLPFLSNPSTTNPIVPLASVAAKPGCFLLQMVWTTPTDSSQHALEQEPNGQIRQEQMEGGKTSMIPRLKVEERRREDEGSASTSTLSPVSSSGEKEEEEEEQQGEVENGEEQQEEERKNLIVMGVVSLNGGKSTDGEGGQGTEGGDGEGVEEEEGGGGEGDQGGEGEEAEGQRENGGGEREEDGEKEKDEDHDRQGEEEEEEDFDDLTQDEDEEEVMSSASEESVLSVPELQVNRKCR